MTNINWALFVWLLFFFIIEVNPRWNILIWLQLIESKTKPEHLSRDLLLIGNTFVKLILYNVLIKLKTFLNKKVLSKSIFYSLIRLLLDSLLIDNILIELISYNTPICFKTLLNKKVLLKSIFCFSIRLFFIFFKYS